MEFHVPVRFHCRSPRPMSTDSLNISLCLHVLPRYGVVCPRSYPNNGGKSYLRVYFALRCFQRLSRPDMATQRLHLAVQLAHQRSVHPGPLVLGTAPFKLPTPTADRDRTVSRRSEPSSRTALMGEQPNPWDVLPPQVATSRHRGAKPPRRCGLLGEISLLSPAYLLSVERWPFHTEPPDHYVLLSHLLDLSVSQLSTLMPLHYYHDVRP